MPVVVWAARPFHVAAFRAAHDSSTMDTLVSMGVIAASLWSLWALFFGGAGEIGMTMNMSFMPKNASTEHAEIYFEAATMVTTFLLAGRYAEARTRYRAGDALRSLLELGAKSANRVKPEGGIEVVPVDDPQADDIVVVKPGEKIRSMRLWNSPGARYLLLTGESIPVHVGPGDEVTGATINTDGQLTVRVTRVGEDTTLARIGQMVTEAQAGKAPVQRLADRISAVFVPAVIIVAILTLIGWLIWGPGVQPVHRGCCRARDRMSMRPGPGNPDRPLGRIGPRRAARHCHQRPRNPGVHPPHRHDGPRQDGHRHQGRNARRRLLRRPASTFRRGRR